MNSSLQLIDLCFRLRVKFTNFDWMLMRARQIFAVILLISVLASTIGIARVSHFCKMNQESSCEQSCHPAQNSPEKCCDEPVAAFNEGNDCCQSTIKLYQQKLITLVKEIEFKFFSLTKDLPSNIIIFSTELFPDKHNSGIFCSHGFPPGESGNSINLLCGKFLI